MRHERNYTIRLCNKHLFCRLCLSQLDILWEDLATYVQSKLQHRMTFGWRDIGFRIWRFLCYPHRKPWNFCGRCMHLTSWLRHSLIIDKVYFHGNWQRWYYYTVHRMSKMGYDSQAANKIRIQGSIIMTLNSVYPITGFPWAFIYVYRITYISHCTPANNFSSGINVLILSTFYHDIP